MRNLAIIPARGGSKRILRKNIKDFLGKPIISYSIEAAINANLFDEVMVSTDDKEIQALALKYGAKVPFLRSQDNSDDNATTVDVLVEVLNNYKKNGIETKYACCIYPTAPFINKVILKNSLAILKKNDFDTVFPIVEYSYPIQRSLQVEKERVKMVWPENLNIRTQDLEDRYHDAGQFYWFSVSRFLEKQKLFSDNSGYIEIEECMVQDIDNEMDWRLAELKYKLVNG